MKENFSFLITGNHSLFTNHIIIVFSKVWHNIYTNSFYQVFLEDAGLLDDYQYNVNHTYNYPYPKFFSNIKIGLIEEDSKGLWRGF